MAIDLKARNQASDRRRLWTAVVAAVLAIGALGLLFRAPRPPPAPPLGSRQLVGLMPPAGSDRNPVAEEEFEFGDPTPLFMPPRWESSELPRPEFAGAFAGYGPHLTLDATALNFNLTPPIAVPAGPAEALESNPPGNPSLGIGRTNQTQPAPLERQARVEVVAVGSGRLVGRYDLPPRAVPSLSDREWHYLDLMGAADSAGLISSWVPVPAATTASGNNFPPLQAEALIALENYLTHQLLLGARLSPGFYRISVGP